MISKKIKYSIMVFFSGILCLFVIIKKQKKSNANDDKNLIYRQMLDNWLLIKEMNGDISFYFKEREIKKIAIYGYGDIGRHLIRQLKNSGVEVEYIIDRRRNIDTQEIKLYRPHDKLPLVDAIVVTPVLEMESIKKSLLKQFSGEIISIEHIIYECL